MIHLKVDYRWWQLNYLLFTPTWGNDPFWRAYLSNGLVQPPTSNFLPAYLQKSRGVGEQIQTKAKEHLSTSWPWKNWWGEDDWQLMRGRDTKGFSLQVSSRLGTIDPWKKRHQVRFHRPTAHLAKMICSESLGWKMLTSWLDLSWLFRRFWNPFGFLCWSWWPQDIFEQLESSMCENMWTSTLHIHMCKIWL